MQCNHCAQEMASTAPIIASVRDPETEVRFCCWECAAMWFNKRAGEILMPDLDHAFFGRNGPMQKRG
jgi:hypothetical protein